MTAARAARGRPKGSGINDQLRLNEIARIIDADPRMKPTTAIKALGITDPSTIRRLRDKFNTVQPESFGAPEASVPAEKVAASAAPRAAALKIAEPVKRAGPTPAAECAAVEASAPVARPPAAENVPIAALLFGFGLNAATAIFEQQMMIAQSVMRMPPVRDLIRHQIAFTEFMLSVARPSPGSRLVH